MAASPVPPTAGDDATREPEPGPNSLIDWLRARDDRQLARLLRLRPDLALPAPADLAALASRVGVRTSAQRAVDTLDAPALAALEALVLAADLDGTVAAADVPADATTLDPLLDTALVWRDGSEALHLVASVRESVGPYPGGLGRPAAVLFGRATDLALVPVLRHLGLPPTAQPRAGAAIARTLADAGRVVELIDACDDAERDVLDRLAAGPPVGTLRSTRPAPGAEPTPAHRLLDHGLLALIDPQRVELPREVGRVLRRLADGSTGPDAAEATGPTTTRRPAPPEPEVVARIPDELDQLGTTAVRETLRLVDALAELWSAQPPAVLRSGGVGVRDLRRTARDLGVDEASAAVIAEVAFAAALINSTNGPGPTFLASTEYDTWHRRETATRWLALASAWMAMTRQPSLINQRGDRDRVISALGPDVERGTAPALRRQVLDQLAALRPGEAPATRAAVLELLAWRQPRRAAAQRSAVEAVLREADLLGVTAAGGLTGYTRTLLAGSSTAADPYRLSAAAEGALTRALPALVDHFLVQPDLTVVVPGPPEPRMGDELALLADVESTGGASVYRITERSVRRALDAGRTAEQLTTFVAQRSRTPVPQALQYMIDDGARRHGVLRAGAASAYLRCEDEALLARLLADRAADDLGLRLLAPTVLVAQAPVNRVLDALRAAGYAPAAESPDGDLITIAAEPPRAPTRPAARPIVTRSSATSDAQLTELVRRVRQGDAAGVRERRVQAVVANVPGVTSAATMELLRTAISGDRLVWLGVAEPDGSAAAHELYPISMAAGMVRGYPRGSSTLTGFPVHRITSVRIVDRADEDPDDLLDDDPDDDPAAGA